MASLTWRVEYEGLEENEWPVQVTLLGRFANGSELQSCFQKGWHTYAPQSTWLTPPTLVTYGGFSGRGYLLSGPNSEIFPLEELLERLELELDINPLEAEVLARTCAAHWWSIFGELRTASTTWPPSILRFNEWDEILQDLCSDLSAEAFA